MEHEVTIFNQTWVPSILQKANLCDFTRRKICYDDMQSFNSKDIFHTQTLFFSGNCLELYKRRYQKKNLDSLPILAIIQNGRHQILEFQYLRHDFTWNNGFDV